MASSIGVIGRPVDARAQSVGYRVRKFIGRNSLPLAMFQVFIAVLVQVSPVLNMYGAWPTIGRFVFVTATDWPVRRMSDCMSVALADTDATVKAAAMCISDCVVHCNCPPANSTVEAGVAQLMLAGASISTTGSPNFSTGAAQRRL